MKNFLKKSIFLAFAMFAFSSISFAQTNSKPKPKSKPKTEKCKITYRAATSNSGKKTMSTTFGVDKGNCTNSGVKNHDYTRPHSRIEKVEKVEKN